MTAKEIIGKKFKITEVGKKIKITLYLDEYDKEAILLEWGTIPKKLISETTLFLDEEEQAKMDKTLLTLVE